MRVKPNVFGIGKWTRPNSLEEYAELSFDQVLTAEDQEYEVPSSFWSWNACVHTRQKRISRYTRSLFFFFFYWSFFWLWVMWEWVRYNFSTWGSTAMSLKQVTGKTRLYRGPWHSRMDCFGQTRGHLEVRVCLCTRFLWASLVQLKSPISSIPLFCGAVE